MGLPRELTPHLRQIPLSQTLVPRCRHDAKRLGRGTYRNRTPILCDDRQMDRAVRVLSLDCAGNEIAGECKFQRHLAGRGMAAVVAPFEQKAGPGEMSPRRAADLDDVLIGNAGPAGAQQESRKRETEENNASGSQSVAPWLGVTARVAGLRLPQ